MAIVVMATVAVIGFGDINLARADRPTPTREDSSVKREPPVSVTNGKPKKAKTGKELKLPLGQHFAYTVVDTPEGKALLTLSDDVEDSVSTDGLLTAAATTQYRKCSIKIYGAGVDRANGWSMKLTSTFWYNYSTVVRQSTPVVSTSAFLPYWWSDIRRWNTYWSSKVRFADGQAVLHGGAFGVGFSWTYHLWIQVDAWGNCSSGWYR